MKDSKQVRSEYQSFVESYSSISAKGAEEAKEVEMKKKSSKKDKKESECNHEMVLMRKSGAFTELAERYQMSVKQFARFVEANQGLFDIETRKKAILANKFSGFKESVEWDEFFGDLELKEGPEEYAGGQHPSQSSNKKDRDKYETQRRRATAPKGVGVPDKSVGYGQLKQSHELEGEELQEVQTKETASGTKYKVRVKEKDTGSSYIRYATREKIAQLRADPKIASVEMTDEGEAPEDKGEKKAQAKGGGLAVKAKKMKEKKEKADAKPAGKVKRSVTTEGLDPVGKEDSDIDNDGDTDKSDEYLHKRRKAIGKAMKKRGTKKESFSNWRDDLREIVDTQDQKRIKGGKVNNKVVINPPMGEDFDPQKVAEALGAELVDCEEQVKPEFQGKSGLDKAMEPVEKAVDNSPQRTKARKDLKTTLQKLRKEAVEPECEQIDEGVPLAIGAGLVGAGLVGAALHRAKKAAQTPDDAAIGKPTIQGAASGILKRKAMMDKLYRQHNQ